MICLSPPCKEAKLRKNIFLSRRSKKTPEFRFISRQAVCSYILKSFRSCIPAASNQWLTSSYTNSHVLASEFNNNNTRKPTSMLIQTWSYQTAAKESLSPPPTLKMPHIVHKNELARTLTSWVPCLFSRWSHRFTFSKKVLNKLKPENEKQCKLFIQVRPNFQAFYFT